MNVHKWTDNAAAQRHDQHMFTLVISVRRGSACSIPGAWHRYATLEEARIAGAAIGRDERVARVAVVRNQAPPAFVEWLDRR